jgi:hypothetical protein
MRQPGATPQVDLLKNLSSAEGAASQTISLFQSLAVLPGRTWGFAPGCYTTRLWRWIYDRPEFEMIVDQECAAQENDAAGRTESCSVKL